MMNEEIKLILLTGNTLKDLPEVVSKLADFSEEELFENLFSLSVQEQAAGKGVAFAAYSLNELNPKCNMGVKEAVSALLKEWDVSIEEVVFYLRRQFGKDLLLNTIATLKEDSPSKEELTRLKAIKYWLRA